ncbi:chorismate mutase [Neorhizobium sp. DAR64872/K0K18]|uniref:chorismate mutase n=1 Tax=Neorhizobium sp. DAR64872/K0K18 TaxID=3421958 RepID=UPI003D27754F
MTNSETQKLLSHHRQSIDNIDAALINILAERFRCTEQVGRLKAQHNLPARDEERERLQLARLRAIAGDAGLDTDFAEEFFCFLVAKVVEKHTAIAMGGSSQRAQ